MWRLICITALSLVYTAALAGEGPAAGGPAPIPPVWTLDPPGRMQAVQFSPDGQWLAVTHEGGEFGARLFRRPVQDGMSGKLLPIGRSDGYSCLTSLAFSPDSRHLAVGSCEGTIHLWDLKRHERRRFAKAGIYTFALKFAPDGKSLYVGRHGGVTRLAFPSGEVLRNYVVCDDTTEIDECMVRMYGLDVSPDGKFVAAGGVKWDVESGMELPLFRWQGQILYPFAVRFSPDGTRIALAGERLSNRDGQLKASGDGQLEVGSSRSRAMSRVLRVPLRVAKFLPNGEDLIIGGSEGFLARVRVKDAEVLTTYDGLEGEIWSVTVSLDGETLAACDAIQLCLWRLDQSEDAGR